HVAASLIGDIEEQLSSGVSTVDVTQNESQNEQAAAGVGQTVVGPLACCAGGSGHQGTNPADDYEVDQNSVQNTSSQSGALTEDIRTTAGASGSVDTLDVFVDTGSSATNLVAGVYSDSEGHPGALLGKGTLNSPTPGAWNAVTLASPVPVTSGTTYWIAVLGPSGGGTLHFRGHCRGGGWPGGARDQSGASTLPASWATGRRRSDARPR